MILPVTIAVLMAVPAGWLAMGASPQPFAVATGADEDPSSTLDAAIASLGNGDGPAGGSSLQCTTTSPTQASCDSVTSATLVTNPPAGGGGENETTSYNGTWLTTQLSRWGGGVAYDPNIGAIVVAGGSFMGAAEVSYLGDTWYFQDGNWTHTYITSSMSVRGGISMTYDARDHYTLMFGGIRGGHVLTENWVFQFGTWTLLKPAIVPAARIGASLAFDSADNTVVLFGGYAPSSGSTAGGTYFADTWYYSGGTWTQVTTTYAPAPRANASMEYDPNLGALVLFGGSSPSGPLADTWTFSHGQWTDLSATLSGAAPPARGASAMAWDDADHEMVMMGGSGASGPLGDAWALIGAHWSPLPAGPSPRFGAMMAYDTQLQALVLFGGGAGTTALGDTWYFQGGSWSQDTQGMSISGRTGASLVVLPSTGSALLFGGWSGSGYLGDSWMFQRGSWTLMAAAGTGPAPRTNAGLAYVQTGPNATDGYAVLYGGFDGAYLNDTWSYANGVWTPLATNGTPGARSGMVFASSGTTSAALLYGGMGPAGLLADTWEFNGATLNWTAVSNTGTTPVARAFAASTYDPTSNSVLIFGGEGKSGYLGDTWEVTLPDAAGVSTWTQYSGAAPSARSNSSFAWVPMYPYNGGVLVGGTNLTSVALDDYWGFSAGVWTQYPTPPAGGGGGSSGGEENTTEVEATSPMPRSGGAMFFTPDDSYLTYFGGQTSAGVQSDSWSLVLFLVQPSGSSVRADSGATIQYHGALFGGTKPFTYLWTFGDGSTSTSATPTHAYAIGTNLTSQVFVNTVVVSDASGITDTRTFDTVVYPSLQVNWTVGNTAADVGVPLSFSSTISGGAPPVKVFWDFGTGDRYYGCNGSYTFLVPGNHTVTFHAFSGGGTSYQNTTLVSAVPTPTAQIRVSHLVTDVGVPVDFSADVRNGVGPHHYQWSFGDGASSADAAASHAYSTPGTYTVSLEVSDAFEQPTAALMSVTVNALPTIEAAVAMPSSTDVGFPVHFTGDGSGGTGNLSWDWDFGDGTYSKDYEYNHSYDYDTPATYDYNYSYDYNHTYLSPGVYHVTVWANDTLGISASTVLDVTVMPLPTIDQFTASATQLNLGDPLTLQAVVSGGVGPYSYQYANLPSGCQAADTPTVECRVNQSGDFSVTLYVTDAVGAQTSKIVALHVNSPNSPSTIFGTGDAGVLEAVLVVAVIAVALVVLALWRVLSKGRSKNQTALGPGPSTTGSEPGTARTEESRPPS